MSENFEDSLARAKSLSGLTPEHEACLKEIASIVTPHLPQITDAFYVCLLTSPVTSVFLIKYEDNLNHLKETHLTWLKSLFTLDIDVEFAKSMKRVGDVHVEVQLPLDFMTGAMSLINNGLIEIVIAKFDDKDKTLHALQAINAITALVLVIMQQSYQLFD